MVNVVVYRLLYNLYKNYDIHLEQIENSPIPKIGEIVNINGNPFVVYRIGHAISSEEGKLFTYIQVFKAGSYELKIFDKTY